MVSGADPYDEFEIAGSTLSAFSARAVPSKTPIFTKRRVFPRVSEFRLLRAQSLHGGRSLEGDHCRLRPLVQQRFVFWCNRHRTKQQHRFSELVKKKRQKEEKELQLLSTVTKGHCVDSGPWRILPGFSCQQTPRGSPVGESTALPYCGGRMSFFLSHQLEGSRRFRSSFLTTFCCTNTSQSPT